MGAADGLLEEAALEEIELAADRLLGLFAETGLLALDRNPRGGVARGDRYSDRGGT